MQTELASRLTRFGAAVIDTAIIFLFYGLIVAGVVTEIISTTVMFGPFPKLGILREIGILAVVAYAAVQAVLLYRDGQTIGKKMLGVRIVKVASGENGGFVTNVLLRWAVNTLLGLIPLYGLFDIVLIFREDRRCIHDFIAGTRVVQA